MSDTSAFGFGQFVPGFDFLQKLSQTASQAAPAGGSIPGMANWVAPTLSVEDIDKRIQELKAVQFWLEQNGTALKATIQALEVQKMTLSTLQSMNVNMADLAKAFSARAPQATPSAAKAPPAEAAATAPAPEPAPEAPRPSAAKTKRTGQKPAEAAAVDPMAWWGSLTQQFQNIASAAMKDVAAEALKAQAAPAGAAAAQPAAGAAPARGAAKKPAGRKTAASAPARKTARPRAR